MVGEGECNDKVEHGEHGLELPGNITLMMLPWLEDYRCNMVHLQISDLDQIEFGVHGLVLPDNITHITMRTIYRIKFDDICHIKRYYVTMTRRISVQHGTQFQHLTFECFDLGEHELVLLDNIVHIELHSVTMELVDLGHNELVLTHNITYIKLRKVTMTGRFSMQHFKQLQHFKFSKS